MKTLVACKRGNIAERSKSGHCQCKDCLEFRAGYRRKNRDKIAARTRQWLKDNPKKQLEYSRRWIAANQEKRRAIEISWKQRNPEKVAQHNSRAGKKWASANKGKRLASVRARQLSKKHRTPPWVRLEEIRTFYDEAARMSADTGIPHEVDHIVPLQGENISGLHVPWNLRVVTRFENRSKGNRI